MSDTYSCRACGEEFETVDELRKHVYEVGLID